MRCEERMARLAPPRRDLTALALSAAAPHRTAGLSNLTEPGREWPAECCDCCSSFHLHISHFIAPTPQPGASLEPHWGL